MRLPRTLFTWWHLWRWRIGLPLAGVALLAWIYRPAFSGELLVGRDAFRLFIPARAFLLECLGLGELPLWNPYLRLGQPFAASLILQGFYPPTWLTTLLFGPAAGFTVQQVAHVALAGVGATWAARALRAGELPSLIAGLVFALSPLMTDLNGHRNVVDSAAWTGFMVVATLRLHEGPERRLRWLVALAAFTTLSFLAGSPETLLWQLLVVASTFLLVERPTRSSAGAAYVAGALCVGLSAFLLLPALEFVRLTTRGAGSPDATDWSASWAQLVAMAWPRADQPRGEYWGDDQWWMVTVFVGSVSCLLALASFKRGSRSARPFLIAAVLLVAFALGKHLPLTAWLWTSGPLGAFRFPAKFLVGVSFCVAILAALGAQRLSAWAGEKKPSRAWIAGAFGIAFLCVLILPVLFRAAGARAGLAQGLPWVLGATVLVVAAVLAPADRWRELALVALVAAELALHHGLNRGFGWERPQRLEEPSELAKAIPDDFHGRISLAMTDALVGPRDPSLPSFIDSSRDALVPNRHLEEGLRALEGYGAPEPRWLDEFQLIGKRSVFDLTGVAYYVRAGQPPYGDLEAVASGPGLPTLYRSTTALPRAFVVHRSAAMPPGEALKLLSEDAQPARETVFVDEDAVAVDAPCQGSTARFVRDTPHEVVIEVDSCGQGYLVLSDAFFPGWHARVDGAEATLVRADYALRAVRVGAGPHTVSFVYRPASFAFGAVVSALSLLVAAVILWRSRRRNPSDEAQAAAVTADAGPR